MSVQYRDSSGNAHDVAIHEAILGAVDFARTAVFSNAIDRLISLGLTEASAKQLMTTDGNGDADAQESIPFLSSGSSVN